MKIEFLYFEGCPSHHQAYRLLTEIMKEAHIEVPIERIVVDTPDKALELKFLGSPSIRIDGRDVEKGDQIDSDDIGFKCRMYRTEKETLGYPPRDMIRKAFATPS